MKVIIVGATGYSGLELIRILLHHPRVEITHLFANSEEYASIVDIAPHLQNLLTLPVKKLNHLKAEELKELKEENDVVFLATPSGVSQYAGAMFSEYGFKVIDLSGDLRIKESKVYEAWYGLPAANEELLERAIYGLSEIYSKDIEKASYIANPGCYATSVLLALAPIYKSHLTINNVIIDAKSGVSGAGKKLTMGTHFTEVNDSFKPYKVGKHQHIPEIEQILSSLKGEKVQVQFMTHLLPMTRGILSTIYIQVKEEINEEQIRALFHSAYENQPFIRILPKGSFPETKQVYGTNFCNIGIFMDRRTNQLILFSAIDNLMKGAAGQAVQNLNLMMGWEQQLGLQFVPVYP